MSQMTMYAAPENGAFEEDCRPYDLSLDDKHRLVYEEYGE